MLKNGLAASEIKANECSFKEKDRSLKEQFINDINDDYMIKEIIGDLTTIRMTTEITSEHFMVG